MGKSDWAIVVGIQSYPEMPYLEGPDNDAEGFFAWVIDEKGGAVPRNHAKLIVTPRNKVPFKKTENAVPAYMHIEGAAFRLIKKAGDLPRRNGQKYIGRRLYLYFAGHGFAPREEQTALIMANATKLRIGAGYHWLGQRTAEWFFRAGYFDEIVLMMDCCRSILPVPELSWPWTDETAPDFQQRVKRFYAFATGWSLEARGEKDATGKVHGVFTQALLDGLRKFGNVPNSDVVTTDSLSVYLRSRIPGLQPSDFRVDSFEIAKISERVPGFPVRVKIPPQAAGKNVEVITYVGGVPNVILSTLATPPDWQIQLEKGLYQARVPEIGLEKLFAVTGNEVPDVEFN